MKKIILAMIMILLCGLVSAHLGNYEAGETVTFSVVCLTDDGSRDTGCSSLSAEILAGNDTAAKAVTTALAEVSDANFPGLLRGDYDLPAGFYIGTSNVYIKATNSNGTLASTVLSFQVVNKSFKGLEDYVDELPAMDSKLDSISADIGANSTYINTSFSGRFELVDASLIGINNGITENQSYLNASFTGRFSFLDATLDKIYADEGANFTNLMGALDGISAGISDNASSLNISLDSRFNLLDSAVDDIYQDQTNGSLISRVWSATARTLSAISYHIFGNWSTFRDNVWNATDRNLTFYQTLTDAQNVTLNAIYSDESVNFSNISKKLEGISSGISDNATYINNSIENVVTHGDANWISAMTTAQNDTLYGMADNTSILNESISTVITHGDANWISAMTTAQNDTLYGMADNTSILNESISTVITHGDANWIVYLTDAQNETLNAIYSDESVNFSNISSALEGISSGIGANQSYLNTSFSGRFDAQDISLVGIHAGIGANQSYLNTSFSGRFGIQDISLAGIHTGIGANTSYLNTSFSGRFGIQDISLAGIHTGIGANTSYLNTSFSGRFGIVDSEITAINSTILDEINKTPGRVWNSTWAPSRILTTFPVGSISTIDITAEGPYNATFFNSEPGHVIGDVEPENSIKLNAAKWARNGLVIEILPANMTRAEICLWIQRTGNPAGQLGVYMGDNFLYNLSAPSIPLTWHKNCTEVSAENVTNYNEITARGESTWTVPNSISVGMDEQAAVYSYTSTDLGVTWIHPTNELIFWIEVGATAESVADQLNEKVVNIEMYTPHSPCIGSPVNFHWAMYDFKGNQLAINSMPENCNVYFYMQNGSEVNITTAYISTKIENSYIAWAFWNNTQDAALNTSYHIDCNGITVTPPSGDQKTVDVDALFGFTEECKGEGRFDAVYGNQSGISDEVLNLSAGVDGRFDAVDGNLTDQDILMNHIWNFLTNTSLGTSIWATTTRTLTGVDWSIFTTWTTLQDYVWSATDRNLTYYQTEKLEAEAVWNYSERNLTYYETSKLEAEAVWNYSERNLTYYETSKLEAEAVWNYSERNLTYYQDTTNYSNIDNATDVWEFSWRTVHGFES